MQSNFRNFNRRKSGTKYSYAHLNGWEKLVISRKNRAASPEEKKSCRLQAATGGENPLFVDE